MEYPRILRDNKKTVKIKTDDIPNIISLYNTGMKLKEIALMYGVTSFTIRMYIDPEFKERCKKRQSDRLKHKWATDPEFRRENIKRSNEWVKNRRMNDDDFKMYVESCNKAQDKVKKSESSKKHYRLNKSKYKLKSKKWRENNLNRSNEIVRNWYRNHSLGQFRIFMRNL